MQKQNQRMLVTGLVGVLLFWMGMPTAGQTADRRSGEDLGSAGSLTRRVENLLRQRGARMDRLTVTAQAGRVTLYGWAPSEDYKRRLGVVAAQTPGVRRVVNRVELLEAYETATDAELKEDVEDQLFWSWFVDADDISVRVRNGVVHLFGVVEDYSALADAIDNAYQAGSRDVVNRLKIMESGEGEYVEGEGLYYGQEDEGLYEGDWYEGMSGEAYYGSWSRTDNERVQRYETEDYEPRQRRQRVTDEVQRYRRQQQSDETDGGPQTRRNGSAFDPYDSGYYTGFMQ